jgi:glyoxylase-like metal-dependent hydrolase (beta-lactamase superfamily II)
MKIERWPLNFHVTRASVLLLLFLTIDLDKLTFGSLPFLHALIYGIRTHPTNGFMMRHLTSIIGNSQKLDGGAMFGHVPKTVWNKWILPDESNRISLACRALLIQEENKNILLEAGIGAFFNPSLRERYGVNEPHHVLLESLHKHGLSENDIDVIILSHLHFDHAGGLLGTFEPDKKIELLFPNAKYLVGEIAWERACNPHIRDRASFIPELNDLLKKSGRLVIIENEKCDLLGNDFQFLFSHGHTPGLMHTVIDMPETPPVIFASDLIPASYWIHLPVTMGYDRMAELLIDEKKEMLELAIKKNARLFYTHDPKIAMSQIEQDETGKFVMRNQINDFSRLT